MKNMEKHYESVGWNFDDKSCELRETKDYLVIHGIGYLGFRDELADDDIRPTSYIYELQIEDGFRSKGVGSKLIANFYDVVKAIKYPKLLMCTVMNSNQASLNFFKKHGFIFDSDNDVDAKYSILSKYL